MPINLRIKPSLEILNRRRPYVREIIRTFENGVLTHTIPPVDHGPFLDHDEASRFLAQRGAWWAGFCNHVATFGPNAPEYPEFVFDEADMRRPLEIMFGGGDDAA